MDLHGDDQVRRGPPRTGHLTRNGTLRRIEAPGDAFEHRVINRPAQPPMPVTEEWNWQLSATCRGMEVELFFHPARERRAQKQRRIDQAKAICQDCPVLEECRRHALQAREPYGIWGGLSEEERAEILGVGNLRYPAAVRRQNPAVRRQSPVPTSAPPGRSAAASSA
ncbi:WhiB family transcriptional regulator [Nakamurella sp.]|uniref:WhiB family transcriptional regulator n=1 Tax=Nakamurella sp. TaxID=1869182 RepID=UPI003B3A46F6